MPMCGFNEKMLNGLRDLQEGLVEHGLYERSKETGQTVEQRLEQELDDMRRFSEEMGNIRNPEMRDIIAGLSTFARGFYKLARKKGLDNYKGTAETVNKYFLEMDRKFYGELQGQQDDMKKLTQYLNEVKI